MILDYSTSNSHYLELRWTNKLGFFLRTPYLSKKSFKFFSDSHVWLKTRCFSSSISRLKGSGGLFGFKLIQETVKYKECHSCKKRLLCESGLLLQEVLEEAKLEREGR